MYLYMLLAVLLVLALVLAYAASRPKHFRVQRQIHIAAPAEAVFALLVDFHHWSTWSPWEKLDPAMQRNHSGAAAGVGAVYEWQGNKKVGKGRMEIIEASVASRLLIRLDFLAPFEAHNRAEFTLQDQGKSCEVSWAMYGPSPFISRLMGLVFNMDKLIGKDFEAGLANLRALVEHMPAR